MGTRRASRRHAPGQEREAGRPEPGYFRLSLTKDGWAVPALLEHDEAFGWRATINGEVQPAHPDPALAPGVMRIWDYGWRSDRETYDWLNALRTWATEVEPRHPAAYPDKPINPMTLVPIIPPAHRIARDE